MLSSRILLWMLACCALCHAGDELTIYDLLAPSTQSFAITYDIFTTAAGSPYLFNPIRRGATASEERVIDAGTGKPLKFAVVNAAEAMRHGLKGPPSADSYIQVTLASPVPQNGERRVRIFKTYKDAASYHGDDNNNELTFERSFGIKRNVIVLPAGYELIGCSAPGIVSTQKDKRIRVSFFNDRDDQLLVRLKGRLAQ